MDVRAYTVGPFQENTYVLRADGSDRAIVIDPGDNGDQLLDAIEKLGATVEAILITHTDVDHVGAVAPLAKATGAPVYCPKLEVDRLADIMGHVPVEGIGPYEGYEADETVEGGETLRARGTQDRGRRDARPHRGPRDVRLPRRGRDRLGRRPVPELGRADRPPQRRPPDAARLDRDAARALPRRHARPPGPHGHDHPRPGEGDEPLPRRDRGSERADPGAARHVRRAARGLARAPRRRGGRPAHPRGAPATAASRRRPSRRPSCSPAAWASRPTSSRRRCTPSRTPAGGRRRCGPRAPRPSRARTSSTACTRRRSR